MVRWLKSGFGLVFRMVRVVRWLRWWFLLGGRLGIIMIISLG